MHEETICTTPKVMSDQNMALHTDLAIFTARQNMQFWEIYDLKKVILRFSNFWVS